ncbi:cupin domain-containing protein [Pirellulaceae bacterium SH449]
MALLHAEAGEIVDVMPLEDLLSDTKTCVLIKSQNFEVIRMVMLAGKAIAEHSAKGEVIVQCLEGTVLFNMAGNSVKLQGGQLIYLEAGEPHSVKAIVDSSLLLTMFLHHKKGNNDAGENEVIKPNAIDRWENEGGEIWANTQRNGDSSNPKVDPLSTEAEDS